jgi:Galactose oxidase, central domain
MTSSYGRSSGKKEDAEMAALRCLLVPLDLLLLVLCVRGATVGTVKMVAQLGSGQGREGAALAAVGPDAVYIFGGFNDERLSDTHLVNPSTGEVFEVGTSGPAPAETTGAQGAIVKDPSGDTFFAVLGGYAGNSIMSTAVHLLSTTTEAWNFQTYSMGTGRAYHGACTRPAFLEGPVHVTFGTPNTSPTSGYLDSTEAVWLDGRPAEPVGLLSMENPVGRHSHAQVCTSSNTIMIFGGTSTTLGYLNDVWELRLPAQDAGVWTRLSDQSAAVPGIRGAAAALTASNVLWVIGGDAGPSSAACSSWIWMVPWVLFGRTQQVFCRVLMRTS